MPLRAQDWIRERMRQGGFDVSHFPLAPWERYRSAVLPLFQHIGINCVLDVGANVGDYGLALRSLGYKGWILSFEPVSATYARLAENAKGDPRWATFRFALGDENAERAINVMSSD